MTASTPPPRRRSHSASSFPSQWKEIADELALHGVQMERTTKPLDQEFDTWRFTDVKYVGVAARPAAGGLHHASGA